MLHKLNRQIQYMHKRFLYQLQWHQGSILIKIEDLKDKKLFSLSIDNEKASIYRMSANQIYQQLYKQYLFSSNKDRSMIKCQNNFIIIHFDFPSARLKQIKFQCEVETTDQLTKNTNTISELVQAKLNQLNLYIQDATEKISQTIRIKINEAVKAIQDKLDSALLSIDSFAQSQIICFQQFYKSKQNQYQQKYLQFLSQSVDKIIEDNDKYFNQFNQIKLDLESNIQILNSNVKSEYQRLEQLEKEIQYYKEAFQDSIDKANSTYLELKEKMEKQFKEINLQIKKLTASSLKQVPDLQSQKIQQKDVLESEAKIYNSGNYIEEGFIDMEQGFEGLIESHSFYGGEE